MEKKFSINRRTSPESNLQSQPEISTYKNQNVVFKIQTGKKQQTYNAKSFPAKFSINISNQRNQLGSDFYNRLPLQSLTTSQDYMQYNNRQFQNMRTQRVQPNFDLQQYEKQLKIIYEDKRKCDQLIMELQHTCQQYQRQNQEYVECLNQKNSKIQQLRQKLSIKDKNQNDSRQNLISKQIQIRELRNKIKLYQNQQRKLRQMLTAVEKQHEIDIQKLELHLVELQKVINEKQETIRNLSNFNNQITQKILYDQSNISKSYVKQMEKWLKIINKKSQNTLKQKQDKQNQINKRNESITTDLLNKSQGMSIKIFELQKLVNYLDVELKKVYLENEQLMKKNQHLIKVINDLEISLEQKKIEKQKQQINFKRAINSTISQQQGGIIYEGTVKVKMQNLLIEKDKRINSLQSQLLDSRRENTLLRSKIYQLDCEQEMNQSLGRNDKYSLKKAKSLGNFSCQRYDNQNRYQDQEYPNQTKQQLVKIMSQCKNLTQTLGIFMQNYKTQRVTGDQFRKSRFSQALYSSQVEFQKLQQMKELMRLQKQRLNILQTKTKKNFNNVEQLNLKRLQQSNYKTEKQNNVTFPYSNDPITQRIQKPDYLIKRSFRSQKSCYLN